MKPELLIPAGSPDTLRAAVRYGADAVYLGGEAYGLRAKAHNFSDEEMQAGIAFAHKAGVKVYVTANVFAHPSDLSGIADYFDRLAAFPEPPDALIISDPGVFSLAKEHCPGIPVHISTQANNTNPGTARFWHSLGACRIVSARELTLAELKQMRTEMPADMELETFVHGAMCISYSGRCLLSAVLTGRDANRGACAHPCRWSYDTAEYAVAEKTRPEEYFPIEEDARGTYILNSKDLCMIEYIPELCDAGIDSFKVEGRMKTALYAAVTARTYRQAIDDWYADPKRYQARLEWYKRQIDACTHRPFGTGFFFGNPGADGQVYEDSTYEQPCVYLGMAGPLEEDGSFFLTQKNKFSVGETIEIMKPDGRDVAAEVRRIQNAEGALVESAPHAAERVRVLLSCACEEGDILRRWKEPQSVG